MDLTHTIFGACLLITVTSAQRENIGASEPAETTTELSSEDAKISRLKECQKVYFSLQEAANVLGAIRDSLKVGPNNANKTNVLLDLVNEFGESTADGTKKNQIKKNYQVISRYVFQRRRVAKFSNGIVDPVINYDIPTTEADYNRSLANLALIAHDSYVQLSQGKKCEEFDKVPNKDTTKDNKQKEDIEESIKLLKKINKEYRRSRRELVKNHNVSKHLQEIKQPIEGDSEKLNNETETKAPKNVTSDLISLKIEKLNSLESDHLNLKKELEKMMQDLNKTNNIQNRRFTIFSGYPFGIRTLKKNASSYFVNPFAARKVRIKRIRYPNKKKDNKIRAKNITLPLQSVKKKANRENIRQNITKKGERANKTSTTEQPNPLNNTRRISRSPRQINYPGFFGPSLQTPILESNTNMFQNSFSAINWIPQNQRPYNQANVNYHLPINNFSSQNQKLIFKLSNNNLLQPKSTPDNLNIQIRQALLNSELQKKIKLLTLVQDLQKQASELIKQRLLLQQLASLRNQLRNNVNYVAPQTYPSLPYRRVLVKNNLPESLKALAKVVLDPNIGVQQIPFPANQNKQKIKIKIPKRMNYNISIGVKHNSLQSQNNKNLGLLLNSRRRNNIGDDIQFNTSQLYPAVNSPEGTGKLTTQTDENTTTNISTKGISSKASTIDATTATLAIEQDTSMSEKSPITQETEKPTSLTSESDAPTSFSLFTSTSAVINNSSVNETSGRKKAFSFTEEVNVTSNTIPIKVTSSLTTEPIRQHNTKKLSKLSIKNNDNYLETIEISSNIGKLLVKNVQKHNNVESNKQTINKKNAQRSNNVPITKIPGVDISTKVTASNTDTKSSVSLDIIQGDITTENSLGHVRTSLNSETEESITISDEKEVKNNINSKITTTYKAEIGYKTKENTPTQANTLTTITDHTGAPHLEQITNPLNFIKSAEKTIEGSVTSSSSSKTLTTSETQTVPGDTTSHTTSSEGPTRRKTKSSTTVDQTDADVSEMIKKLQGFQFSNTTINVNKPQLSKKGNEAEVKLPIGNARRKSGDMSTLETDLPATEPYFINTSALNTDSKSTEVPTTGDLTIVTKTEKDFENTSNTEAQTEPELSTNIPTQTESINDSKYLAIVEKSSFTNLSTEITLTERASVAPKSKLNNSSNDVINKNDSDVNNSANISSDVASVKPLSKKQSRSIRDSENYIVIPVKVIQRSNSVPSDEKTLPINITKELKQQSLMNSFSDSQVGKSKKVKRDLSIQKNEYISEINNILPDPGQASYFNSQSNIVGNYQNNNLRMVPQQQYLNINNQGHKLNQNTRYQPFFNGQPNVGDSYSLNQIQQHRMPIPLMPSYRFPHINKTPNKIPNQIKLRPNKYPYGGKNEPVHFKPQEIWQEQMSRVTTHYKLPNYRIPIHVHFNRKIKHSYDRYPQVKYHKDFNDLVNTPEKYIQYPESISNKMHDIENSQIGNPNKPLLAFIPKPPLLQNNKKIRYKVKNLSQAIQAKNKKKLHSKLLNYLLPPNDNYSQSKELHFDSQHFTWYPQEKIMASSVGKEYTIEKNNQLNYSDKNIPVDNNLFSTPKLNIITPRINVFYELKNRMQTPLPENQKPNIPLLVLQKIKEIEEAKEYSQIDGTDLMKNQNNNQQTQKENIDLLSSKEVSLQDLENIESIVNNIIKNSQLSYPETNSFGATMNANQIQDIEVDEQIKELDDRIKQIYSQISKLMKQIYPLNNDSSSINFESNASGFQNNVDQDILNTENSTNNIRIQLPNLNDKESQLNTENVLPENNQALSDQYLNIIPLVTSPPTNVDSNNNIENLNSSINENWKNKLQQSIDNFRYLLKKYSKSDSDIHPDNDAPRFPESHGMKNVYVGDLTQTLGPTYVTQINLTLFDKNQPVNGPNDPKNIVPWFTQIHKNQNENIGINNQSVNLNSDINISQYQTQNSGKYLNEYSQPNKLPQHNNMKQKQFWHGLLGKFKKYGGLKKYLTNNKVQQKYYEKYRHNFTAIHNENLNNGIHHKNSDFVDIDNLVSQKGQTKTDNVNSQIDSNYSVLASQTQYSSLQDSSQNIFSANILNSEYKNSQSNYNPGQSSIIPNQDSQGLTNMPINQSENFNAGNSVQEYSNNYENGADDPLTNQSIDIDVNVTLPDKSLGTRPLYNIKYRIPFDKFISDYKQLISKEQYLKANPDFLFEKLTAPKNNISKVFKNLSGQELKDFILHQGEIANAKIISSYRSNLINDLPKLRNDGSS